MRLAPLPASPSNAFADNPTRPSWASSSSSTGASPGRCWRDPTPTAVWGRPARRMVACATCHDPARGGADPRPRRGDQPGGRLDRAQQPHRAQRRPLARWQFWDGRRTRCGARRWARWRARTSRTPAACRWRGVIYEHYREPYEKLFGAMPDHGRRSRFPPAGKPGHARLRHHGRAGQGGRQPGVRQLRQGHRGLRADAGRQVVDVRSLPGRRRAGDVARPPSAAPSCSWARPPATSATRAR